jgi:MFS family permease
MLWRLAFAMFAVQGGFHGFTASLPLALARSGVPDPEIGLVMGASAVVQIPAAFIAGSLVDRFGGHRLFVVGALAYLLAAGILALGIDPTEDLWPYLLARAIQGVGIAASVPAALSLIPALVARARRGFALSIGGSAQNLALVVLPPLSLAILGDSTTLERVAAASAVFLVVGIVLGVAPAAEAVRRQHAERIASGREPMRRIRVTFRRSWALPLLTIVLYVAHWGTVTAYLPARAEDAGANVGLFFAADGLAILLLRVPTGWAADRVPGRWLVVSGITASFVSISLLLLPPTTEILILSGLLGGAGGGLVITPILVELSRRSDEHDRGSAFSLFSGALAGAIALGSVGAAPIVGLAGFEAAIVLGLGCMIAAIVVALIDDGLAVRPHAGPPMVRAGAA